MTRWLKRILLLLLIACIGIIGICAYRMHTADRAVPVLNYHQINDRDQNSLTVQTAQFEEEMQYLVDNGYHAITPEEMLDAWENGTPLPEKPVIITFDDGYVDNYKNAFPILQKYNLKATIFLISDFMGTYPNYMTWGEVEEMQQSGLIDFESHTLSHPELDKIPADEVWTQLSASKQALEWRLNKPIRFIAYPCGSYDQELERMTKEAGYRAAFTVHYGLASPSENPFVLDRVPIFGCTTHQFLRCRLRLEYAPIFAPLDALSRSLVKDGHTILAKFVPAP